MLVRDRQRQIQIALWAAVMLVWLVASLRDYDSFQLGAYNDDASYVVLARSLVSGTQFGFINEPGLPAPTRYPFGFPLLLSPFALLFPSQPELMKYISLAATFVIGVLLFWGWRRFSSKTSAWWGLAVTALFLWTPLTVSSTRMVMSEPVFTAFALGAILWSTRVQSPQIGWLDAIVLSVLLLFTVFVRTVGVAMLGALFVLWLYKWRLKALRPILIVSAGIAVLVGVVVAATTVQPRDLLPLAYSEQLTAPSRFRGNVPADNLVTRTLLGISSYASADVRQSLLPIGGGNSETRLLARFGVPWVSPVIGILFFVVVASGTLLWYLRENLNPALLFGVFYFGIIVVWGWDQIRFLYPIQPQLYFTFLLAVVFVGQWLVQRLRLSARPVLAAAAVMVTLLLAANLYKATRHDPSAFHTGDLTQRTAWLRDHSEPGAVILTQAPQADYLYSARRTQPYPNDIGQTKIPAPAYVLIAPDVVWNTQFSPAYDQHAQTMLVQVQQLASQGKAARVYLDVSNEIQVYKLIP